jgi:hypothetical protein
LRQKEKLELLKKYQESFFDEMDSEQQKKSKEQILAERQAKKLAKKSGKNTGEKKPDEEKPIDPKTAPKKEQLPKEVKSVPNPVVVKSEMKEIPEKSKEEVAAQREAKKIAKQAAKHKGDAVQKPQSTQPQTENVKKTGSGKA